MGCLALVAGTGCAGASAQVNVERLMHAKPVVPTHSWRLRVPNDVTLPRRLTRTLCDEFVLLEIHNYDDLSEFYDIIGLPAGTKRPDLNRGMLIGVIASVGESMSDDWPVSIEKIRLDGGDGWIRARFHPGAYYPINIAAYCHLAYIPGLERVMMVEINRRTFVAQ